MTRQQWFFSLGTGIALLAAGTALAAGSLADWGLFWVGAIISTVAVAGRLKETRAAKPARVYHTLPVAARVSS